MFLARRDIMELFTPGDHGSTFGGNPLAAAIGLEALDIIVEDDLSATSAETGNYLIGKLRDLNSAAVREVRGRGLFVGIEIDPAHANARQICEDLMEKGVLSKETHETVVRLAPPLIITREQIDWAVEQIREVLDETEKIRLAS